MCERKKMCIFVFVSLAVVEIFVSYCILGWPLAVPDPPKHKSAWSWFFSLLARMYFTFYTFTQEKNIEMVHDKISMDAFHIDCRVPAEYVPRELWGG